MLSTPLPLQSENTLLLHDVKRTEWLLFTQPVQVLVAFESTDVINVITQAENYSKQGFYVAGFVSYEAAVAFDPSLTTHKGDDFPLAWFGVYSKPSIFNFPKSHAIANKENGWRGSITQEEYSQAISTIHEHIVAGDTYQVNFTYRLQSTISSGAWDLFVQMIHAQNTKDNPVYGSFISLQGYQVLSASPELFFTLEDDSICSRPMKGTAARGFNYYDDIAQYEWLKNSQKNQAENLMIVDMVRNDIGRIAEYGSISVPELFQLHKYPTVWQMTSKVVGKTKASIVDIFKALYPASSITGAPKKRTMELIKQLEPFARHIYTGSIGYISPDQYAQFNVAIRTVLINTQTNEAEYGVGGGIVYDSDSHSELQEANTKANVLTENRPQFELIETILWSKDEGYYLLELHLKRLDQSAFYFDYPCNSTKLQTLLLNLKEDFIQDTYRVRVLLSNTGVFTLEYTDLISLTSPYTVAVASTPVDSSNIFLHHKTTHRQIYNTIHNNNTSDTLFINERNEITESCIANIVIDDGVALYTPPLSSGLLAGVYREHLLNQGTIVEKIITPEELLSCKQIYLINSVRKMWPVSLQATRMSDQ